MWKDFGGDGPPRPASPSLLPPPPPSTLRALHPAPAVTAKVTRHDIAPPGVAERLPTRRQTARLSLPLPHIKELSFIFYFFFFSQFFHTQLNGSRARRRRKQYLTLALLLTEIKGKKKRRGDKEMWSAQIRCGGDCVKLTRRTTRDISETQLKEVKRSAFAGRENRFFFFFFPFFLFDKASAASFQVVVSVSGRQPLGFTHIGGKSCEARFLFHYFFPSISRL